MKFCPECGIGLKVVSSKFCVNCGTNLLELLNSNNNQLSIENTSLSKNISQNYDESKQENWTFKNRQDYTTIHNLGVKLEEAIDTILKNKGTLNQSNSSYKKLMK